MSKVGVHQVQVYFAFPYIQLVLQLLLNIEYIELYSDEKAELEKIGVGPRADDYAKECFFDPWYIIERS